MESDMKAKSFLLFVAIFLCLSLCALSSARAEPARVTYKIAVIIPLTGPVSSLGQYVKNGIDLALDALPKEQKDAIEVTYDDDQWDPLRTLSAYRKLKREGGADAVFVIGSPTANALVPITEKDKTILIGIGASDPTIAVGRQYSFIHWVTPAVLGETLATELKRRNFKKIALIVNEVSGALADMNGLREALSENGLADRIVYHQTFLREVTDYRTAVAQMKHSKADAVVAALFPGPLSAFAKQFRAAGLSAELIGIETFEDESEVKASEGALNGAWYVNASDSSSEFIAAYKAKYKEHPGWGTGNGYDSLTLIAQAVAKAGPSSDKLRDYLRSVKDHQGACGVYSASGDNRFTLPAALKRITDKGFVPYLP